MTKAVRMGKSLYEPVETVAAWSSLFVLLVTVTLAALSFGGGSLNRVAISTAVNMMFVISLYAFSGNSGVISFGHVAFAGVGAYTAAILVTPVATKSLLMPDMPDFLVNVQAAPPLAALAGGVLAAVVGAIFAPGILRLGGLVASIATFALLLIVNVIASNWREVTGGVAGFGGVPMNTSLYPALGWLALSATAAFAFQRSRWGLKLRATREDEPASRAGGISIFRVRFPAWLLSAFMAGITGALYGQHLGSFSPADFYLPLTFLVLTMLVVGGLTSLLGAVCGTVAVTVAVELLRIIERRGLTIIGIGVEGRPGITEVGLALVLLVVLFVRPAGLTNGRELHQLDMLRRRVFRPSKGSAQGTIGKPNESKGPDRALVEQHSDLG